MCTWPLLSVWYSSLLLTLTLFLNTTYQDEYERPHPRQHNNKQYTCNIINTYIIKIIDLLNDILVLIIHYYLQF